MTIDWKNAPEGAMQPKQLTQAVFDGLPPEYRWAAVDANARACAYTDDPEHDEEIGIFGYFNCTDRAGADYIEIGYGYDATDWQDSKIEREPSVAEIVEAFAANPPCFDDLIKSVANAQTLAEAQAEIERLRAEVERLKVGNDRYEILRTLNPRQFADLYAKNLETGTPFDELVDDLARGDSNG